MARVENMLTVSFTPNEAKELLKQAALKELVVRYPGVRLENLVVRATRAHDEAGAPDSSYFAVVSATIASEGGES